MQLTIATYHYVRDTQETAFPRINALSIDAFREQLGYISKHHTIVSANDVIATVLDPQRPLPPHPALLTFDDGYLDHFDFVFPILQEAGVSGAFFQPTRTVTEKRVLDVNKIHFILASTQDIGALVKSLNDIISEFRPQYDLASANYYWDKWAKPGRWDPLEIIYIKRMLQKGLPCDVRSQITDLLFRKMVTNDEADFADHLYMSSGHLTKLIDGGMYVGNHSYAHNWLNSLTPEEQEEDIDRSLDFLKGLGVVTENWMMCYPYGGYDDALLRMLREKKCAVGLTVKSGIADLDVDDPLALPRIDTNDFPKNANAPINQWTAKAIHPAQKDET